MDPRDFQKLAHKLVEGTTPAEVRTAISRAYYAAYSFANEILTDLGFRTFKNAKGHKQTQFRLNNSGDDDIIQVGSKLTDLETKRIRADYQLNRTDVENPKTAKAIVLDVDRVFSALESFRNTPERCQRVAKAIEEYDNSPQGRR